MLSFSVAYKKVSKHALDLVHISKTVGISVAANNMVEQVESTQAEVNKLETMIIRGICEKRDFL